jgi:hypothetical protein
MKILLLLSCILFAQSSTNVSVDLSQLSSEARNEILNMKAGGSKPAVETAKEWAGVGAELGKAIASTCKELSIGVNDFVKTPVGKFTMLILAWKLIGKDFLALGIWIVWTSVCIFFMRYLFGHSYSEEIKGDKVVKTRVESFVPDDDYRTGLTIATIITWAGVTIPCLVNLFG